MNLKYTLMYVEFYQFECFNYLRHLLNSTHRYFTNTILSINTFLPASTFTVYIPLVQL